MATRTLTVALRALIAGYTGPMRAAAAATGPLEASLMRVQRAGLGMAAVGATLTRRLTLPLAAAGVAALKLSTDFDTSMTKVATLTAATSDEVDSMRGKILELSVETGRSANELAKGFFVAVSATRDASTGMEILERAAKAAALGLGDTETIARAAASVINAYGTENISAARATDVLVATAEAGNFSVDQLAGALGRVLPFARQAGVSFEDVGGAIAVLTATTGDANTAVTNLAGLLRAFVTPTRQTEAELAKLGLTAGDVRTMLGEQGLEATLIAINERMGGVGRSTDETGESWGRLIGRAQGTSAVLDTLNISAQDSEETFGRIADASGILDERFEILEQTTGFKLRQALMQLQNTLIEIGDVLGPIAVKVAGFARAFIGLFSRLPGPIQTALIAIGLFAASLGPLLRLGGNLALMFGSLGRAMLGFVLPAGTVSGAFGGMAAGARGAATAMTAAKVAMRGLLLASVVGAAIVALGLAFEKIAGGAKQSGLDLQFLARALETGNQAAMDQLKTFILWEDQFGRLDAALKKVIDEQPGLAEGFIDAAEAAGVSADKIAELREQLEHAKEGMAGGQIASERFNEEIQQTAAEMAGVDGSGLAGEMDDVAGSFEEAASAISVYLDQIRAATDPLFAAMDASQRLADATDAISDAQQELMLAHAGSEEATMSVEEAERNLERARIDGIKAAADQESALLELADAAIAQGDSLGEAEEKLRDWGAQAGLSQQEIDDLVFKFLGLKISADEVPEEVGIDVSEVGADAVIEQMTKTTASILGIPEEWVTHLFERGADPVTDQMIKTTSAITGIPTEWLTQIFERGANPTIDQMNRTTSAILGIPLKRNTTLTATDNASGTISSVISQLRLIPRSIRTTISAGFSGVGRQHGGPVSPSRAFLVGEAGPELFVPHASGRIVPHGQSMSMLSSMRPAAVGGGGGRMDMTLQVLGGVGGDYEFYRRIAKGVRTGELQFSVNGQRVRAA